MEDGLRNALLEAIWLMRWNKEGTAMTAVLTVEETFKMCDDIVDELDKAGYEIFDKFECQCKQRDLLVSYENFKLMTPQKFSCSEECIDYFLATNIS